MAAAKEVNLSERIAEQIGERIIRGELAPGARVLEVQLAEALGASRGPVREALRILEKRRLVQILPRRGAMVTGISNRDIECLYDVVIPLYELLARETAKRWLPEGLPPIYTVIEKLIGCAESEDVAGYYEHNFAFAHACFPVVDNALLEGMLCDLEPGLRRVLYLSHEQRAQGMGHHLLMIRTLIRHVTDRDSEGAARTIRQVGEFEKQLALQAVAD